MSNANDVAARLVREYFDGTAAKDLPAWASEAQATLQRLTGPWPQVAACGADGGWCMREECRKCHPKAGPRK